jgi:hypothetical protein
MRKNDEVTRLVRESLMRSAQLSARAGVTKYAWKTDVEIILFAAQADIEDELEHIAEVAWGMEGRRE